MSGDILGLNLYNKLRGGDDMINASTTGKKIAELRKEKGLTQKDLAEKLNVTDKAVSKWERGINFPELTVMEILATELDTTVVDLLSLEKATSEEVVEEVTKISLAEKNSILNELRIRSYLKILIEVVLFIALVKTSKILNDNGIYGQGQMLTMGLLGFVGSLIGMEIYTIKNLYIGVKSKVSIREWKWIETALLVSAIASILIYLGIQFFSGYGPNNVIQAILLFVIAISIQILFERLFNWRILKTVPLFLSVILALWGTWLYLTSESWMNAEFSDLFCGYITPFIGCLTGWLLTYRKKN